MKSSTVARVVQQLYSPFAKSSGKGQTETPVNRNNLRLPLTVTVALCDGNPLHPLGNERQCKTRCQETRFSLVGLSGEAGQLFTFVWYKPKRQQPLENISSPALNGHEMPLLVFAGNFRQGPGKQSLLSMPLPLCSTQLQTCVVPCMQS